jgi:hypothetical protein
MITRPRRFAIAALMLVPGTGAAAAEADPADSAVSAGAVQDMCSTAGAVSGLACNAYLRGAMEGLLLGQLSATGDLVTFCLPVEGISSRETRSIFLSFVGTEPARRGDDAGIVLLTALENVFPCPDYDDLPDDGPGPAALPIAFIPAQNLKRAPK